MSSTISNRMPVVVVEYDYYGHRNIREFGNAYEARRFYVAKLKAGKKPAVRKPASEGLLNV